MWGRKLRRAFERSGARAPGAVVGWSIVVVLMLAIPATRVGLIPVGEPSEPDFEGTSEGDELTLGPTVTSSAGEATTNAELDSTLTTIEPQQELLGPTVPAETAGTAVISTTSPATTAAPTSESSPVFTTTTEAATAIPTSGEPTTATPTTETPTTETSATGGPATAAPTTAPSTTAPSTTAPSTSAPSTSAPSTTARRTTTTTTPAIPTTAPSTTRAPDPAFAVGDGYRVESGKSANLRVLNNDGDQALLDRGTLEIIVAPSHAENFGVRGNHIHYESDADYAGPDSLRYRICTIDGVCSVATVSIQVVDD